MTRAVAVSNTTNSLPSGRKPRERDLSWWRPRSLVSILFLACLVLLSTVAGGADQLGRSLELSRPVRPWEFLSVVGTRGGLFGNESGKFEAWLYPLKILRDFRLRFHSDGHVLPAETLARTITVHPESTTVVYVGDTFTVRETLLVPVTNPVYTGAQSGTDQQMIDVSKLTDTLLRTSVWPALSCSPHY